MIFLVGTFKDRRITDVTGPYARSEVSAINRGKQFLRSGDATDVYRVQARSQEEARRIIAGQLMITDS